MSCNTRSNHRIAWIDYAKAFSIACVVLHHTQTSEPIYSLSYQLCLAAFFIIAGVFLPIECDIFTFIKQRSKQLLLPYVIFAGISYIVWLFLGRRFSCTANMDLTWWEPLWGIVIGTRDSLVVYRPLWFLPALFISELVSFCIFHYIQKTWYRVLLVCISMGTGLLISSLHIILPWGLSSALVIVGLVAVGHWLATYNLTRLSAIPSSSIVLFLISGISIFSACYLLNPCTEISQARFGHPLPFLLGSLATAVIWISISLLIDKSQYHFPLLRTIGYSTLLILCLHIHCFSFIKAIAVFALHINLTIFDNDWMKWVLWFTTFVILYPICWIYQRLMHHEN